MTGLKPLCIIVTDDKHTLDCTFINSFVEIKTILDFRPEIEFFKVVLYFSMLFSYNTSNLFKKYVSSRSLLSDRLNFTFEMCTLSFVLWNIIC